MGFSPVLLSFQGYCIVYEEKEVMFQSTHICDILLKHRRMFHKGLIDTIMHEKSVLTLEYPKIMEKVAKEAAFSASKELVQDLQPTPVLEEARRRLAYTT